VLQAVENVVEKIAPELVGLDAVDQVAIDRRCSKLDGTPEQEKLGANAMLGVSLAPWPAPLPRPAICRCTATSAAAAKKLPTPLMNILNGGSHADNNVDDPGVHDRAARLHDLPRGAARRREVFHALKKVLKDKGLNTAVGRRGRLRAQPREQRGGAEGS
jgi:enolase